MTKKQFVEDAVAQLEANPRKVLAGHGISGAMLQKIMKRPDVMKYLCMVLSTLKTAKRGAMGLKKSKGFQIKAYKNFPELNLKARQDLEKFMATLDEKDLAGFTNKDNVSVIVFDNSTKLVPGPEGDDVIETMMNASVFLPFDRAVKKEYKLPGVSYVVVMVAPSAIRPAEEKLAVRKEKMNTRVMDREAKAAKIRSKLKKRARKALMRLKAERTVLQDRAFGLRQQNAQYDYITKRIGGEGATDLWSAIEAMNAKGAAKAAKMLNSTDGKLLLTAYKMIQGGDEATGKLILSKIKNKTALKAALAGRTNTAGNDMVDARRKQLGKQIKEISKKLETLQVDLALAPAQKVKSVKSMISHYTAQLRKLQARYKFYSKNNNMAMSGKAQQLAQVQRAIQANIEEGQKISTALTAALAELEATPAQKQQIKQNIVQQVADGVPMQFAIQQAIQESPVGLTTDVEGSVDFNELMGYLDED